MKRPSSLLCGALLLGVSALLAQVKVPVLSFDAPTKDFGKVTEGAILKHVFRFANKGQVPLEILKVEPS
jgi:hypothetical protein